MNTRQEPVDHVGAVSIYVPAPGSTKIYFRLRWEGPDGSRKGTTAGRRIEEARAEAKALAIRLSRAASPLAVVTMHDIVETYLTQGRSPYKNKPVWQQTHKDQLRNSLTRSIEGDENLQAMDITRDVLDHMGARGGTDNVVKAYTSALRGLLRWRHRFARICVDDRNLEPGQLMAIGGWENLDTVNKQYPHSGDGGTPKDVPPPKARASRCSTGCRPRHCLFARRVLGKLTCRQGLPVSVSPGSSSGQSTGPRLSHSAWASWGSCSCRPRPPSLRHDRFGPPAPTCRPTPRSPAPPRRP